MTPPETQDRNEIRRRFEQYIVGEDLDGVYQNYGDANPAGHGGIWIAYDVDHKEWDIWLTTHASEVGGNEELAEDDGYQYVEAAEIRFADVVAGDGSWNTAFESVPEVYSNGPDSPLSAVVDDRLTWVVAGEARNWSDPYPYRDPIVREDSYEAVLNRFGVEPRDE